MTSAGAAIDVDTVRFGPDGLVPIVAQDAGDGRVLMVGYADAEALAATVATGLVHFHSRSRDRLWRKGETSGNELRVVDLAVDCDSDAVLARVQPAGPTCHRGTRSCFDPVDGEAQRGDASFSELDTLWRTIHDRAFNRPAGSYTAELLNGGVDAAGRKVVEEATEVLMAAKDDDAAQRSESDRTATRAALAAEVADLLYHSLVLLTERDVEPSDVLAVLRERRR
ncbi:MAG TPA: bifunctional phosphoribosyl-AMP cyclohydrolase/phosphoribosyl-ATP diphosphatase HisIE [Candidatus Limnocylindrales bacterium]|jgi:phosphoribosyl-ATP pyrophosphohydrolase/phosphoribosyl-AMP cyclohydrolase